MASQTEHYGLTKLEPGEDLRANGGKFASSDRDLIDQALHRAVQHHHTGDAVDNDAPGTALDLAISATGGTIPAGTTVRYVYTVTDPASGETQASPIAEISTPAAISEPAAPTATMQSIGGSLVPGQYFYALSAYQGETTVETKAINPLSVQILPGTVTNQVILDLPALPAGATGFNIYRRAPGETRYYFLDSETTDEFVDSGVAATTRTLPSANTTNGTYSVDITLPVGATVPASGSWTIYRSYTTSFAAGSRLVSLSDMVTTHLDVGNGTSSGSPPTATVSGMPPKVVLTAGAEVQGVLPDTMVAVDDAAFTNVSGESLDLLLAALDAFLGTAAIKTPGWELNGQTADKTLAAYVADAETTAFATALPDPNNSPASADVLRDDLVANTLPVLRTALTDLNNLRVAYENLRLSHEDLRGVVAALVAALDDGT